jgi:hypothetical protein
MLIFIAALSDPTTIYLYLCAVPPSSLVGVRQSQSCHHFLGFEVESLLEFIA